MKSFDTQEFDVATAPGLKLCIYLFQRASNDGRWTKGIRNYYQQHGMWIYNVTRTKCEHPYDYEDEYYRASTNCTGVLCHVTLQKRNPIKIRVKTVSSGQVIEMEQLTFTKGFNDRFMIESNSQTGYSAMEGVSDGSGTGCRVWLDRDAEGNTIFHSIANPGNGYVEGEVLTYTPYYGYPKYGDLDSVNDLTLAGVGGNGTGVNYNSPGPQGHTRAMMGPFNTRGYDYVESNEDHRNPGGEPRYQLYPGASIAKRWCPSNNESKDEASGGGVGWASGNQGTWKKDDSPSRNLTGGGASYMNLDIFPEGEANDTDFGGKAMD